VINNAGILSEKKPLHEISVENWCRVTEVNQNGPFHVMKAAVPRMMARGGGVIINMAATAAIAGVMNNGPYSAAKAALVRMTREAAVAYGPHNIRVNAIAPGAVMTEAMEQRIAEAPDPAAYRESLNHLNPLPGMPDAADVAAAVTFLASDNARFISGAVLPVDGAYACR
jgi:NAD(P)-dependent dehydrogenase (short-subunit alcohol dehydrogenase family)